MNARKVVTEYRLAKWQEILNAKPESGLSVEAYCRSIGVSSFQYYYWQKKLRDGACEKLIESSQSQLVSKVFTEVTVSEPLPALENTVGSEIKIVFVAASQKTV